jgi:hypothetical protein
MEKKEVILCSIILYSDRETPYIERYLATEGKELYSVKSSYSISRINKKRLMKPCRSYLTYEIWCLEKDKKQAIEILYNFAVLDSKQNLEEIKKEIEGIEKIDITRYTLRDYTIPIKPFEGDIKL